MRAHRIWTGPKEMLRSIVLAVVTFTPGPFGHWLRFQYYRRRFRRCGTDVIIDVGVIIDNPQLISVGSNVHIDKYCVISTGTSLPGKQRHRSNPKFKGQPGDITIGSHVHVVQQCILMGFGGIEMADHTTLSAGTKIYSMTNTPNDPSDPGRVCSIMPYSQAPFLNGPVVLEENVWTGLHVVVMPGVTIGRDSFVVSNSLVMSSSEPNSYIAGQPARVIRRRFEYT